MHAIRLSSTPTHRWLKSTTHAASVRKNFVTDSP
jgi:hypothetical protein